MDLRIDGPGQSYAKVVADSISEITGDRLTSFEVCFHRFTLAEMNTHCVSGNTMLEFDMPTGQPSGGRRVFKMPISEFVDKWQNGAAPRPNKGGTGFNRQPLRERLSGMRIRQLDELSGLVVTSRIVDARSMGRKQTYKVIVGGQREIFATADHLFLTPHGYRPLGALRAGDEVVIERFGKREEDLFDSEQYRRFGNVWRCQWQRNLRKVFLDENRPCARCGRRPLCQASFHVHHKIPVHVAPERALDETNVEWLCRDCHYAEHADQSTYSRGGTYLYGAVAPILHVYPCRVEEVYDIEVEGPHHNFIANGFVVHNCVFARNSASSRAIPLTKQLKRYKEQPAFPVEWSCEQPGMSGGAPLEERDLAAAIDLFMEVNMYTRSTIEDYLQDAQDEYGDDWKKHVLHKSLINRLLEPMQWHTALITAATYDNFFDQRCAPDAQLELQLVAEMMRELYMKSTPRPLERGQWHLPYVHGDEDVSGTTIADEDGNEADAREVCSARCARLSYMSQAGERSFEEDLALYSRLLGPGHWSPLEHICCPWPPNIHQVPIIDPDNGKYLATRRLPRLGKFPGWRQWRHIAEARMGVNTYR